MKIFLHIVFIVVCATIYGQSFEVYNGDTINRIDKEGRKQGKWIITGKNKKRSCYKEVQIVETGIYKNNKKEGLWCEYFCNGNLKNKLPFIDGKINGEAITYYENGKVNETGTWKIHRWIGAYHKYDSMGTELHSFMFDSTGKRISHLSHYITDVQPGDRYHASYFRKLQKRDSLPDTLTGYFSLYNKQKHIAKEGNFYKNKLVKGTIYIYNEQGYLINIMHEDTGYSRPFPLKNKVSLNGYHKLYNSRKLVSKEGIFKNNILFDGKSFSYDSNGEYSEINVYKNGMWIGNVDLKDTTKINYIHEHKTEYNDKGKISRQGSFENGKLIRGEEYFYNKSGKLIRVDQFKNGAFVGSPYKDTTEVHEGAPVVNPNVGKIAVEGKFSNGQEVQEYKQETTLPLPYEAHPQPKISGKFKERKESVLEFKSEYNKRGQLVREGSFKRGKLWSGEKYFYSKKGKLLRVKRYKDGKYIGEADPAH